MRPRKDKRARGAGSFLQFKVGDGEGGLDGAALQVHAEVGDQVHILAVMQGIQHARAEV